MPDMPPRAGHADAAYEAKYGLRDPRGGGRASARETAARVAAGAIARLVVPEVRIEARVAEIGGSADEAALGGDARRGPRRGKLARRRRRMRRRRRAGRLGRAGLRQARRRARRGPDVDQRRQGRRDRRRLRSGAAGAARTMPIPPSPGGITGGISTGEPIVVRAAFKPTSLASPRSESTGRHDPCVGLRGAPVVEAMVALVLADHKLLHRAQCG